MTVYATVLVQVVVSLLCNEDAKRQWADIFRLMHID